MMVKSLKYIGLIVMLGLTGCGLDFTSNDSDAEQALDFSNFNDEQAFDFSSFNGEQVPMVSRLMLNGETTFNDRALVVRERQTIELTANASSSAELGSIEILISQDEVSYTTLATCDSSPCRYNWTVSASDNGIHSFRVEATDVHGGFSSLPHSNSLVVQIP